jgi:Tfp pilus assembly protein PilN
MNLSDELRSLPSAPPRADGWTDVLSRLDASRTSHARRRFALQLAAAASVAVIAVTTVWRAGDSETERPGPVAAELTPLTAEQALALDRVAQLQSQSQALDEMLSAIGERPRVERAGSSMPIDTLEGQVQWIDHQISVGDGAIEPDSAERLWRTRVEAMNSLVQLRFVEAQRIDI